MKPRLHYMEWLNRHIDNIEVEIDWGEELQEEILDFWSNVPTDEDHVAFCHCCPWKVS